MNAEELQAIRARAERYPPMIDWDDFEALLTEVDRLQAEHAFDALLAAGDAETIADLRVIEAKAQAQAEYIQTHDLTEYEQARLRAEVDRLRAALERVSALYPTPYVERICRDALGR
jgi:hypothetical protein